MIQARQLRTLHLQHADPADLQDALDRLRNGQSLTALQSGTVAYDALGAVALIDQQAIWDGIYWNVFLFVSTG